MEVVRGGGVLIGNCILSLPKTDTFTLTTTIIILTIIIMVK